MLMILTLRSTPTTCNDYDYYCVRSIPTAVSLSLLGDASVDGQAKETEIFTHIEILAIPTTPLHLGE